MHIVTFQSIARQQLSKHLPLVLDDIGQSISIANVTVVAGQSPNINISTTIEVFSIWSAM
jgi:hypothetical protein